MDRAYIDYKSFTNIDIFRRSRLSYPSPTSRPLRQSFRYKTVWWISLREECWISPIQNTPWFHNFICPGFKDRGQKKKKIRKSRDVIGNVMSNSLQGNFCSLFVCSSLIQKESLTRFMSSYTEERSNGPLRLKSISLLSWVPSFLSTTNSLGLFLLKCCKSFCRKQKHNTF